MPSRFFALSVVAIVCLVLCPANAQDTPPTVRSTAVVNLTFDEPGGTALDSATAGAAKDDGLLVGSPGRIRSPFWNQAGKSALVLDAAAKQYVQIADSADVDRPAAATISLFVTSLHGAKDNTFRGMFAKREANSTNYGINYGHAQNLLQVYIHDGTGFRSAQFDIRTTIRPRMPVYLTAVMNVGDAPEPDTDTDADDVNIRLYINGKPAAPRRLTGTDFVTGDDAWLTNIKIESLVNNTPVTIGSSQGELEVASLVVDEFSLFDRALSPEDVAKLFAEVAGPNPDLKPDEKVEAASVGPEITLLSTLGVQVGQTTRVVIRGTELDPMPQVLFAAPGATATVVAEGTNAQQVTVDLVCGDVPAGHYPLRVQTSLGVSNALPLAVDSLPHSPAGASTAEKPLTLPAAVTGYITGQQTPRIYFQAKAGDHLIADVEARRLGGALTPVLELRSPKGTPLAIEWGHREFHGDARIDARIPADGVYMLDLHDLAFAAPGANPFRIKLGDLKLADVALPAAVPSGASAATGVVGPGFEQSTTFPIPNLNAAPGSAIALLLPAAAIAPAPAVLVATGDEVLEAAPAEGEVQNVDATFVKGPQTPTYITGRLLQPGEQDVYVLKVTPGAVLRFETDSRRVGTAIDPTVSVQRNPDGALLAASDDRPQLVFTIPAGQESVKLVVSDLNGRGGRLGLYRIKVAPENAPDFDVTLTSGRVGAPKNGNGVLRLEVSRRNYGGPIALSVRGAEGFSLSPSEIPANISKTFVTLVNRTTTAPMYDEVQIVAESVGLTPSIIRTVQVPPEARLALVAGSQSKLGVVSANTSAYTITADPLPAAWVKGTTVEIPLKIAVSDPEAKKGYLRLSLMTTEVPRLNDPNDANKGQKPLIRSLAEQSVSLADAESSVRILVPLDLGEAEIDGVIRADLVANPFSEAVITSVFSQPFRLPVVAAGALEPVAKELQLTGKQETKFAGMLKREGYQGVVKLSLVNLPAGYEAPAVAVAAGEGAWELSITAPAVAAAADIPNVVLRVTDEFGSPILADVPLPTKVAAGQ